MVETNLIAPPQPEPKTWTFVDVLLMTLGSIVVLFAGVRGLAALKLDPLVLTLGASALEAIALAGSVYLLGLKRRRLTLEAVGLRRPSSYWTAIAIAAGIFAIFFTGLIAVWVQMLLHRPLQNPQLPFIAPEGFTWVGAIGLFLLAGLAIPFAEELFFRGVLYTWLRQRWGVWVGAIGSALIFGVAHGDIAIAAGVAVMGLMQAVIYERSRSLWTTFLIHAINNGVKIVLVYALLAMGVNLTGK